MPQSTGPAPTPAEYSSADPAARSASAEAEPAARRGAVISRPAAWRSNVLQSPHRVAGALEKIEFVLLRLQPHRRADRDAAQKRNRQKLPPRQNAIEVINIDWHQFQVGPLFAQVIQPRLE